MRVDLRCDRRARRTACAVATLRVERRASHWLLSGSGHNGIGLHLSGSGDLCHCPRRCRRIGRHLDCRAGVLRRTAKEIVHEVPLVGPEPLSFSRTHEGWRALIEIISGRRIDSSVI